MSAVEITGRAVCRVLAADPETWRGFEEAIRAGLTAFIETLPSELAERVRQCLETTP